MKFRTALLVFLALSFLASTFLSAEVNAIPKITQATGVNTYGDVTLDSLQGNGLVKLNGTSILNTLQVAGSLISNHAEIGSIEVSGEANLTHTTIHQGGSIVGSLQAVRSTCSKPLIIQTQKAVLTASRFDSITIRKDAAYKGKQVLELKQGTIIDGPVVFEGGKGELILFPGCQVLGSVTGGKIVKKS